MGTVVHQISSYLEAVEGTALEVYVGNYDFTADHYFNKDEALDTHCHY